MEKENHGDNTWLGGYRNSIDPTTGTGIRNVKYSTEYIVYIYDGTPIPPTPPHPTIIRKKFPWVLYSRKFRNNRYWNIIS